MYCQFTPTICSVAHHPKFVVAGFGCKAYLEPLRSCRFELQNYKVILVPVSGKSGRNILNCKFLTRNLFTTVKLYLNKILGKALRNRPYKRRSNRPYTEEALF